MKIAIAICLLAACAADPVPTREATGALWTIHTASGCNGQGVTYDAVALCTTPSSSDVYLDGDWEAKQYSDLWKGACTATEGTIANAEQTLCLTSDGQPAPYRCDVWVVDEFSPCGAP